MVEKRWRTKLDEVRQRFRLTAIERRVAVFVAAAFVLGLITKCYRDGHPSPALFQTHSGGMGALAHPAKTTQSGVPNSGQAARRPPKSEEKLDLSDSATKQEHRQK
jgi:hypothetical protein